MKSTPGPDPEALYVASERLKRPMAQYTASLRRIFGRSEGARAARVRVGQEEQLTLSLGQNLDHLSVDGLALWGKVAASVVERDEDTLGTGLGVSCCT